MKLENAKLLLQFLDIVVKQRKNKYVATSIAFPNCKGIGESEKEALTKLIQSISRNISKLTKDILTNILFNDDQKNNQHLEQKKDEIKELPINDKLNKHMFAQLLENPQQTDLQNIIVYFMPIDKNYIQIADLAYGIALSLN